MTDEQFIEKYEELLDKGYCDCNEMNCIDNDTPRKILNIVKGAKLEAKQLLEENKYLKDKLRAVEEVAIEHLKKEIELKVHQKEFIEWLEDKIKNYELPLTDENKKALGKTRGNMIAIDILEEYQKIIGGRR